MKEDIPIEELYSQPVVQELLEQIEKNKDLENIKIPYTIKNKVLMSPGVWNNFYYGPDAVKQAYLKSKWNDKEVRSLFLDHADKSSREWIGEVVNPRLSGEDVVGDLVIVDKPTAQKLAYGAKMGISPKVHGEEDNNKMVSFLFDNFSVVINPAVKTAYINNMEDVKMAEEIKSMPSPEQATPPVTPAIVVNAEPAKPTLSELDAFMADLCNMTEALSVTEIAKKAKEIRKEGESWTDAIKRAAKMMAEEEMKKKCATAAVEDKKYPYPTAQQEIAANDAIDQIVRLASMLKDKYPYPKDGACASEEEMKNKKYPYPNPAQAQEKAAEKTEEVSMEAKKMEEMGKTIQTLSEQVTTLTKKLNEPDKKTEKTAELSEADAVTMIKKDPDAAFLSLLRRIG